LELGRVGSRFAAGWSRYSPNRRLLGETESYITLFARRSNPEARIALSPQRRRVQRFQALTQGGTASAVGVRKASPGRRSMV